MNTLTDLSKKLLPAQVNAGGACSVAFTHTRIYGSTQQNYGTLQVHREAKQLRLHLRVDGDLHTLTIPQAEALIHNNVEIHGVIELVVADEEIIKRMSGRRIHLASGRTYHVDFNPPNKAGIDDETGEDLVIRKDDEPETVKDRLKVYWTQTQPLIEYYSNSKNFSDLKYLSVDGTLTVDEIKKILKNFFLDK